MEDLSESLKLLLLCSILISGAGLILIFGSAYFGTLRAESWLRHSLESYTDSETYLIRTQAYIQMFQIVGGILFGAGLLTIIAGVFRSVDFQTKSKTLQNNNET